MWYFWRNICLDRIFASKGKRDKHFCCFLEANIFFWPWFKVGIRFGIWVALVLMQVISQLKVFSLRFRPWMGKPIIVSPLEARSCTRETNKNWGCFSIMPIRRRKDFLKMRFNLAGIMQWYADIDGVTLPGYQNWCSFQSTAICWQDIE